MNAVQTIASVFGKSRKTTQGMAAAMFLTAMAYNSFLALPQGLVVQTTNGLIRGQISVSRDGRQFYEFLGIPYAKPPVGSLRFEPPHPPNSWKGIRSANKYSAECLQLEVMVTARIQGEEDCLYLNVFSPKIENASYKMKPRKLLPVMVFIHGGLFMAGGSTMYGPKYFMDEDVVLVTFNYRLASLGFLNTGDEVVRGNMGLKDQNMVLRWVQMNIWKFQGDPTKVTLFGESAGGASVHYHMMSPLSAGLFHKALTQSGNAIHIWALNRSPREQAIRLAKQFNCPVNNSEVMIDCLRKVDGRKLVTAHIGSMTPIRQNIDLYVPTVETVIRPDTFLLAHPNELLKNGSFQKIPWLMGVNQGEGLLNTARILANTSLANNLGRYWNSWLPRMLDYDPSKIEVSSKIRQYYFPDLHRLNPHENVQNLTRIYSDRVYFHAAHKCAEIHSQHAPVFLYYFKYQGQLTFFSLFKAVLPQLGDLIAPELKIAVDMTRDMFSKFVMRQNIPNYGPCHADELFMLFNMHPVIELSQVAGDVRVSKALVKSWVNFATNEQSLFYQNHKWPSVTSTTNNVTLPYMQIESQGMVIDEPFQERIRFWDSLAI